MRVLALAQDGFGGFGGIARYDAAFLSMVASRRTVEELVVLARLGSGAETPERCRQLGPYRSKQALVMAALALVAVERRFDLLWCGHVNLAPLALVLARLLRCPWWLQIHGIDAWERPGPLRSAACERADLVLSVSRYTRHRFLGWARVDPNRVRVLPNVVDRKFSPGQPAPSLVDRYVLEGRRVMLTVARLSVHDRYKGVDRVLRLMPALRSRFPDLVYLVVGDGDDRPRLAALARDLGISDAVRFAGRVPDEELVDHYRLADLFVMPSSKEGFGIVFLEAMACGVPAVGLDVDGSVDPLSLAPLGHAVPEAELLPTILRLLSDPPPRHPPARLRVFSNDVLQDRVEQLLSCPRSRTDESKASVRTPIAFGGCW